MTNPTQQDVEAMNAYRQQQKTRQITETLRTENKTLKQINEELEQRVKDLESKIKETEKKIDKLLKLTKVKE